MATALKQLNSTLEKILTEYQEGVVGKIDDAVVKAGRAGVKALRANSQVFGGTGKYAKGWSSKTEKSRLGTTVVLYNQIPGLPHLLEHGHAKRNGGRVAGRVHIAPVEQELIEMFTKSVEEAAK